MSPSQRTFSRRAPKLAGFAASVVAMTVLAGTVLAACGSADVAVESSAAPSTVSTSSTTKTTPKTTSTTTTPTPTPTPVPESTPEPAPAPPAAPAPINPLTGLDFSANPVLAVKIDNTDFGGLQYGTSAADIVYVEQVEGGLTRLVAVFHSTLPEEVGPVRSVRTTDAELLRPLGKPALVFSGGSGVPVQALRESPVIDASQGAIGGAYWRSSVASGSYNLHANLAQISTSIPDISQPNNIGFTFGADYPAMAAGRDVTSLAVSMSRTIKFTYNDGAYQYIRKDKVSVDGNDGATIAPVNLLVQNVQNQPDGVVDTNGSPSYKTDTVGSGTFTLYRDGKAIDGTWSRTELDGATSYLDGAGAPVLFKPGKTWVMLAPQNSSVSEG
ncbi:DUF3048 domain-containing protein [Nakamurella antarctica]|uniref:DUF3048 domain-containing protein n=1 Tax=Nakamurella antarctica TaxID=1902245 RepID=A0A3G8ZKE2_9ACTN|nr:DUF3048 domain-containing protein [Nakamurella antarctica]AZI57723.1 DUF3048 domain-containing protein [Nakamurella antarctica]